MKYADIPDVYKDPYTKSGQNRGMSFKLNQNHKELTVYVQTINSKRALKTHIAKLQRYGRFF